MLWFFRTEDFTIRDYYRMSLEFARSELCFNDYQVFRHCYNRKMEVYLLRNKIKFKKIKIKQ